MVRSRCCLDLSWTRLLNAQNSDGDVVAVMRVEVAILVAMTFPLSLARCRRQHRWKFAGLHTLKGFMELSRCWIWVSFCQAAESLRLRWRFGSCDEGEAAIHVDMFFPLSLDVVRRNRWEFAGLHTFKGFMEPSRCWIWVLPGC